jgi:hypothetical protein
MKSGLLRNIFPLLLLAASAASAQHLSFGVIGGFPLTYSENTTNGTTITLDSTSRQFIFGGTAEVGLPFGLSVEGDFLYHPFNLHEVNLIPASNTVTNYSVFEVPVLAKLLLGKSIIAHPFAEAGPEFRANIGNLTLSHDGFVVGGGVEFKLPLVKISPELRYTRWASGGLTGENLNQAAFLVGVSF